jgi:MarR family transcriptional regulator, organic hydroperoxide resistance regulator
MNRDDRLIFLLSTVQQAVKNYTNKALAAEGVRITVAQSGILFLLKQQDRQMISELGKLLGIENSAMTGLVDRLEKSGFVRRAVDPADRRALLLCATLEGLAEVEKAKPIIKRVNDAVKEGLSEDEVQVLKGVLDGIVKKFKRM